MNCSECDLLLRDLCDCIFIQIICGNEYARQHVNVGILPDQKSKVDKIMVCCVCNLLHVLSIVH